MCGGGKKRRRRRRRKRRRKEINNIPLAEDDPLYESKSGTALSMSWLRLLSSRLARRFTNVCELQRGSLHKKKDRTATGPHNVADACVRVKIACRIENTSNTQNPTRWTMQHGHAVSHRRSTVADGNCSAVSMLEAKLLILISSLGRHGCSRSRKAATSVLGISTARPVPSADCHMA